MDIKTYLWLAPFLSFTLGYIFMQRVFRAPEQITPHLIGKQIHEVLPAITQQNLNLRLINQKEEADLPEGIILNQTPTAGTTIKANQPLFIVTTKKPSATRAPDCLKVSIDELVPQLQATEIHPRIYYLSHPYPEKICFAQSPQPHEPLEKNNNIILYISSGNNKPVIWPRFIDQPLQEVVEFLNNYNIQPDIINNEFNKNSNYIVTDQRPFAGTLITLDESRPLSVQLRVH